MNRNKIKIICYVLIGIILLILGVIASIKYNMSKLDDFDIYGDKTINMSYTSQYEEAGYVLYNSDNYKYDVKLYSNYRDGIVGSYSIDYVAYYNSFKKTVTRNINVIDDVSPILNIDADDEEYITVGDEVKEYSYYAIDDYEGDITSRVTVSNNVKSDTLGDYKIIYEVSDSSGNKTKKEIIVHVGNKFDHTYIKISIKEQKLWYYKYNKIVLETPITSGAHNATPTGNFKILKKVRNTVLSGATYSSYVKYWMAFKGNSYGIHDASWRSRFGTSDYNINGSHGCVNTPTDAMEKLYDMVEVGTPVYIYK